MLAKCSQQPCRGGGLCERLRGAAANALAVGRWGSAGISEGVSCRCQTKGGCFLVVEPSALCGTAGRLPGAASMPHGRPVGLPRALTEPWCTGTCPPLGRAQGRCRMGRTLWGRTRRRACSRSRRGRSCRRSGGWPAQRRAGRSRGMRSWEAEAGRLAGWQGDSSAHARTMLSHANPCQQSSAAAVSCRSHQSYCLAGHRTDQPRKGAEGAAASVPPSLTCPATCPPPPSFPLPSLVLWPYRRHDDDWALGSLCNLGCLGGLQQLAVRAHEPAGVVGGE